MTKYLIIMLLISCKPGGVRKCAKDCETVLLECKTKPEANLERCEEQASLCLEFCRTKYGNR